MAKRTNMTGSTTAAAVLAAAAAPAAVAPAPVPPVPAPVPNPGLPLAPELWHGIVGRCVLAEVTGYVGKVLTLSRWVLNTRALQPGDRVKAEATTSLKSVHDRLTKAAGEEPAEHPVVWERDSDRARAIVGTLQAAPGTWPFERTDVVVADLEAANSAGLGGEFFRVYVNTDPAATGAARITAVPDILALNLGDPAHVWPSLTPGYLTDGMWAAIAPAAPDVVASIRDRLAAVAAGL